MPLAATKIRDASIRKAYKAAGHKINNKEMAKIIKKALDLDTYKGKKYRISPAEKKDLLDILEHANLTTKAKQRLDNWIKKRKKKRNKKEITELEGKKKSAIAKIICRPSYVNKIHFTSKGITYKPAQFAAIAQMIEDDFIDVYDYHYNEHDSLMRQARGSYSSNKNDLYINLKARRELLVHSTIIHEATHAIQDMLNNKMHRWDLEAAAHIAQAVMILSAGNEDDLYGRLKHAKAAATSVMKGSTISDDDYEKVRDAMKKSYPPYKDGTYQRDFGQEWYSFFEEIYFMLLQD